MTLPAFMKQPSVNVKIEAEVADRAVQRFSTRYHAISGVRPVSGRQFHTIVSANDNKRGLEGRVYFNATAKQVAALLAAGFRVQGPRTRGYLSGKFAYRIDKNSLFWDLVVSGHRL